MHTALEEHALDQIFRTARTHSAWLDQPVPDALLRVVYELARWGPTSANMSPLRVVFVKSREAKARLRPALSPGNVEKTMTAPATAILAHDLQFYELLPLLFPHTDARSWFVGDEDLVHTSFRNGTLQAGYFMVAARALGLDCGPMSGFDNETVDAEFFPGGRVGSNCLCNLGYGDPARLPPRSPRLAFDEACSIL